MRIACMILLVCFISVQGFGQELSGFLWGRINSTVYDKTIENNTNGFGLGVQAFLDTKSNFKPTLEMTWDLYPKFRKLLILAPNGDPVESKIGVLSFFAGTSFHPVRIGYISFLAGPCFINRKAYLGIEPSLGIYFSRDQRWSGKISFRNVFQNDQSSTRDFGVVSVGIAVKLF
jgi:hypothetical protein